MKILHYFLGFPPYRSGGLTKFCMDLMHSQIENGDTVDALWPGKIDFLSKKIRINNRGIVAGIQSFELINPLPVPLDEGIINPLLFMKKGSKKIYSDFFNKIKVDVIHIHTFMGLHKEFVEVAKSLKIKTIFTTHDYFGLCPKVTFFKFNTICEDDHNCIDCVTCNQNALSLGKIIILQSPLYRVLKESWLIKKLRNRHRNDFFSPQEQPQFICDKIKAKEYENLRLYYLQMFNQIDIIHYNSSVSKMIYEKFISPKKSTVISISNMEIEDNRTIIQKTSKHIRFTYLSPLNYVKGFSLVYQVFEDLWESGKRNFELHLFSELENKSAYMKLSPNGFQRKDLLSIFQNTDILLAPSIWYETFGFTVLEALSYGVPVIVSDRVGAKDIIGNGGIVVKAGSYDELYQVIANMTFKKIKDLKKCICTDMTVKKWCEFTDEMNLLYKQ